MGAEAQLDSPEETTMKKLSLIFTAIALMTLSAFASHTEKNLLDTAGAAGTFKTLTQAVQAAGMEEMLKSPGAYTVFAPTDEAFARLPEGTLEVLMKPENKEQLRAILAYHIVPGRITSADVAKLSCAHTVNGQSLRISRTNGQVRVNDSRIVSADVRASNGIIHVIDKVALPRLGDLPQVAAVSDKLARFESTAIDVRKEAASLESRGRNPQVTWRTHAERLHVIANHVNEMGRMMTELELMKPQATLLQVKAIEASRPHLQDLAQRVEKALGWLNQDQRSIALQEYKENLGGLAMSADNLYKTVDTIIDYQEASRRLNSIEPEATR
jgi:uncharacterized surface protein with fasciclin (FAS1) repeats